MDNYDLTKRKKGYSLLLIISVFICTYFIYTDFSVRQFLGYGVLILLMAGQLKISMHLTPVKIWYMCAILSVSILFAMPHSRHDYDTASYMFAMYIYGAYLLFASYDNSIAARACQLFQVTSALFAGALLLFKLFPQLYWNNLYPLLSDVMQEEASIYVQHGYGIPIGGGYTYPNYVFALSALISVATLMAGERNVRKKRLCMLHVFIAFAGILLMGRRGELLALIFSLVFILLMKRRLTIKKSVSLKTIAVITAVTVTALVVLRFLFLSGALGRYLKTYHSITNNLSTSVLGGAQDITSGRVQLWKIALGVFWDHPIFGVGWEQFGQYVPASFSAIHGRGAVTHAHNDYLELLCENGVIGAFFVIVPLFSIFLITVKQALRLNNAKQFVPQDCIRFNLISLGIQSFFFILSCGDPCFYAMIFWCFYSIAIIFLSFSIELERFSVEREFLNVGIIRR